jgi:hypothetical protein
MLELLSLRERGSRRDTRLQGILQFIHTNVWRALFGRVRPTRDARVRCAPRRGCVARQRVRRSCGALCVALRWGLRRGAR